MQISHFDISHSHYYPKIISDYLNNPENLKPFYKYNPEISSFKNVIDDFSKTKFNRKLLVDVLTGQYSTIKHSTGTALNISHLLDENTFTVCTGHQLCIFTGPLYFIYKIISTINLSEILKMNFPSYNFVPVYWMASEDHDFEEINHIHLFGKKMEWKCEHDASLISGAIKTDTLKIIIEELQLILGESENAHHIVKLFSNAYLKNNNLAGATRFLVHELFGEYGLLVIDGNEKRLKHEFSEIIKVDIQEHTNYKLVTQTNNSLTELSYKHQVNPREINVFYLNQNERTRIENSSEAIVKEITLHPERFSPNVVLRPLYQQKILPNIAYVGGPNEIAYWLQYKKTFDKHEINFPVLILRNSVLWIDNKTSERLLRLQLDYTDLFDEVNSIVKKYLLKNSFEIISLNEEKEKLTKIFANIFQKVANTDVTLKAAAESELQRIISGIENLEKKLIKAEKQKNETTINQIKNLKEKLFPENNLQERHENFIPYYLKFRKQFFEILKENLNPFDKRLCVFMQ